MYEHAYLFITCKWLVVVMLFIKIFFICIFFIYTSILDLWVFFFFFCMCRCCHLFLKSFSLKMSALKPLLCWTNKGVRQHVSEASQPFHLMCYLLKLTGSSNIYPHIPFNMLMNCSLGTINLIPIILLLMVQLYAHLSTKSYLALHLYIPGIFVAHRKLQTIRNICNIFV